MNTITTKIDRATFESALARLGRAEDDDELSMEKLAEMSLSAALRWAGRDLERLLAVASARGLQPGWAYHRASGTVQ